MRQFNITADDGKLALAAISKTVDGQRALQYILSLAPLYEFNFTGDPIKDAYANGQRSMALILWHAMDKNTQNRLENIDNE